MYLGAARKKAGFTQAKVAELTNIPLGTIRRWEQGINEPDIESLVKLAKLYGVTTDTLLGTSFADPSVIGIKPVPSESYAPLVGRIAAGTPLEAIEMDGEQQWVDPSVLDGHPGGFFLTVSGDSMNLRYPDGCMVYIDKNDREIENGKCYAVLVNGDDATLKQVFKAGDTIVLHPMSSNPEHKDRSIDTKDSDAPFFSVVGRACWYVGQIE